MNATINELPEEMLRHILSYIQKSSDIINTMFTCRSWFEFISNSAKMMSKLEVNIECSPSKYQKVCIRKANDSNHDQRSAELLNILDAVKTSLEGCLTTLELRGIKASHEFMTLLSTRFSSTSPEFTHLRNLILIESSSKILNFFKLEKLEHLTLVNKESDFVYFVKFSNQLNQLESLKLRVNYESLKESKASFEELIPKFKWSMLELEISKYLLKNECVAKNVAKLCQAWKNNGEAHMILQVIEYDDILIVEIDKDKLEAYNMKKKRFLFLEDISPMKKESFS